MARTVILEFEDDAAAKVFVKNTMRNRSVLMDDGGGGIWSAAAYVSAVYKETYTIEGKADESVKLED